jgi:carboxylate-amine ligase
VPGAPRRLSRPSRFARALPPWAAWRTGGPAWTLGVEEEVMLLDGRTWAAAHRVADVLDAAPPDLRARASAETHACVVEVQTGPRAAVADAVGDLTTLRRQVDDVLRGPLDLRAAVAGTNPLLLGADVEISPQPRYQTLGRTMRAVARREPTMALHVHVAVPDPDLAVRVLDGLRPDVPVLLALAANSPFWGGEDSGFASIRIPVLSMFPRMGLARAFGSFRGWVDALRPLVDSGAIPDPGHVWWDVRLQPRLGTVEVRVMDAQSRVADTAALAAIVQCLVRLHAEGECGPVLPAEALAENRFLAARDGLRAGLIDPTGTRRRPAREALAVLVDRLAGIAAELGCAEELAGVWALAENPGHDRQRAVARRHGIPAVPAHLAAEFLPAPRPTPAGA